MLDDIGADAIKIGMLGSAGVIEAVAAVLERLWRPTVPLVIDPVMVAKVGRKLLDDQAHDALMSCPWCCA